MIPIVCRRIVIFASIIPAVAQSEPRPDAAVLSAFGDAVRARRIETGLSQEALAAECDLHRTYVGGIERGERNVGLINIVRIARALDTTAAELLASAR
jgi:ribosome-binding protein aMBF1 (putative translation factor)